MQPLPTTGRRCSSPWLRLYLLTWLLFGGLLLSLATALAVLYLSRPFSGAPLLPF